MGNIKPVIASINENLFSSAKRQINATYQNDVRIGSDYYPVLTCINEAEAAKLRDIFTRNQIEFINAPDPRQIAFPNEEAFVNFAIKEGLYIPLDLSPEQKRFYRAAEYALSGEGLKHRLAEDDPIVILHKELKNLAQEHCLEFDTGLFDEGYMDVLYCTDEEDKIGIESGVFRFLALLQKRFGIKIVGREDQEVDISSLSPEGDLRSEREIDILKRIFSKSSGEPNFKIMLEPNGAAALAAIYDLGTNEYDHAGFKQTIDILHSNQQIQNPGRNIRFGQRDRENDGAYRLNINILQVFKLENPVI